MTINWIKCSERMPPSDTWLIMNDIGGCLIIKALRPVLPKFISDRMQWTPYTEEAWNEINSN